MSGRLISLSLVDAQLILWINFNRFSELTSSSYASGLQAVTSAQVFHIHCQCFKWSEKYNWNENKKKYKRKDERLLFDPFVCACEKFVRVQQPEPHTGSPFYPAPQQRCLDHNVYLKQYELKRTSGNLIFILFRILCVHLIGKQSQSAVAFVHLRSELSARASAYNK